MLRMYSRATRIFLPMDASAKIYVAGHNGLVGSALVRALRAAGYANLLLRSHQELDLREQTAVRHFFATERPQYVFMAAARVGGIQANASSPAPFIQDNLLMQCNVIDSAWRNGCRKLLFLGSSCIYPRLAPQPMPEECLLTGPLEPTNACYALAKIAGIRTGQAYRQQYGFDVIAAMPTNLYGPGDNFHPQNAHVLPALLRRFHEARRAAAPRVVIWGTGAPLREFLHVDDMADACLLLMRAYSDTLPINVGSGKEISILRLAHMVAQVVGYTGEIVTDPSKPDGTPRKLMDSTRLWRLGWRPRIGLREGLASTYAWYCRHLQNGNIRHAQDDSVRAVQDGSKVCTAQNAQGTA